MKRMMMIAAVCAMAASCNFVPKSVAAAIDERVDEIKDELEFVESHDSRKYVTRSFDLEPFSAIECSFACDIYYSQGAQGVELSAAENIIDRIVIKVENGVLKIGSDGSRIRNAGQTKIYVSSETLKALQSNGAMDFETRGPLALEDFVIQVNGAADLEISDITASSIKLDINGAADAEIERMSCVKLEVYIKGAGDCELSGRADDAFVSVSGAGNVDVSDLRSTTFNSSVKGAGVIERD